MKKISLFLLTTTFIISCSNKTMPVLKSTIPVTEQTVVLNDSQTIKVQRDNDFALRLLQKTVSTFPEQKNIFISPLSVNLALGMVRNGASGQTRTEMDAVLAVSGLSDKTINSCYNILQTNLPYCDKRTTVNLSNSIWYSKEFSVKNDFLQLNSRYFNAYVKALDFSKSWAKDTINNWCARNTQNRIPTIIDNIPQNAVMYLTNAVYFKGMWAKRFKSELTTQENFTSADKQVANVPMMHMTDTFRYAATQEASYIELPYGNGSYNMLIALPASDSSVNTLLASLNTEKFNRILSDMEVQTIAVGIPRFSITNTFEMKEVLQALGMKQAFSESANFSGITQAPVKISEVTHKTFIKVDEEGTEAAAVTNIGMVRTSLPVVKSFFANRPFVYFIRERASGSMVFCGIISKL